jgi:hypothetical protein
MAIGDAAAAKGLRVVPATKDLKLGYEDINQTQDELAAEIDARVAGDAAKLNSTKLRVQPAASARPSTANVGDLLVRY